MFSHGLLDEGIENFLVNTADASAACHTDVDVALATPACSPGVLNDPIVF